jgi:hypothetical protein
VSKKIIKQFACIAVIKTSGSYLKPVNKNIQAKTGFVTRENLTPKLLKLQ